MRKLGFLSLWLVILMTTNHVCGQSFIRTFVTPPLQEGQGDSINVVVSFEVTDEEKHTVAVTGYKGVFSSLQLPGVIVEDSVAYAVTAIADGAFSFNERTEWEQVVGACLVLPDEVEAIGDIAFMNAPFKVCWGNRLKSIGERAFWASKQEEAVLPATLQSLDCQAFAECDELRKVDLRLTKVEEIADETFYECKSLVEIELPPNLTVIGNGAFWGCENLKSIALPDSMIRVGDSAFENCLQLKNLDMGSGLKLLGDDVFSGCKQLESVTWSGALTTIGSRAFKKCEKLTTLCLPEKMERLENAVFQECTALEEVTIPEGVKSLGEEVFRFCTALQSVTLPQTVESIGAYAFADCTELLEVELPQRLTSIEEGTFCNCFSLAFIECPDGVTMVGDVAFKGCENLVQFDFPKLLTVIGYEAFYGCSFLEKVLLPAAVEEIGEGAFSKCASLERITVEEGNGNYCSKQGVLFTSDMVELICYPVAKGGASYTVPKGVEIIGQRAFECNATLSSIEVGPQVKQVEDYAFAQCEMLANALFLGEQTTFGEGVFSQCLALESVTLPGKLEQLPANSFFSCESLTSLELPATVVSIGERALEGCVLLERLVLPAAVEEIGGQAFFFCEGLQNVVVLSAVPPFIVSEMIDDGEMMQPMGSVYDNNVVIEARAFSNYNIPLWVHGYCLQDYLLAQEWSFFNNFNIITEVYAEDVEIYPHGTKTLSLAFQKDYKLDFDSISFTLKLPEGYSLVEEEGEVVCTLAEELQGNDVTVEVEKRNTNEYLFKIGGEMLSKVIENGDLITLALSSDTLLEEKRMKADISNIRLVGGTEGILMEEDASFFICQEEMVDGDYNFDGMRSVMDIMVMIDYILQNNTLAIPQGMADRNGDHLVNIIDVMLLVQTILHTNQDQVPF
ncbi:MAG: leucine-rich repeat protein [Prevotella sp.]|nr:leucine-rich repeat protein [Prevotella sp.]